MSPTLDSKQNSVRKILMATATGSLKTDRARLISYKELWEKISRKDWGRARTREIVSLIVDISVVEITQGRPPLNELVVRKNSGESGDKWEDTKRHLEKKSSGTLSYRSHREAQEACWRYWGRESTPIISVREAEEGFQQDRTIAFRKRNARLITKRRQLDDHTCQACQFRLELNGTFIIDCHHKFPLSHGQGVRITRVEDLICLCPTCHRIAHTSKQPLDEDEIRVLKGIAGRPRSRF